MICKSYLKICLAHLYSKYISWQRFFKHTNSSIKVRILHRYHHIRTPLTIQTGQRNLLKIIKSNNRLSIPRSYLQLYCLWFLPCYVCYLRSLRLYISKSANYSLLYLGLKWHNVIEWNASDGSCQYFLDSWRTNVHGDMTQKHHFMEYQHTKINDPRQTKHMLGLLLTVFIKYDGLVKSIGRSALTRHLWTFSNNPKYILISRCRDMFYFSWKENHWGLSNVTID